MLYHVYSQFTIDVYWKKIVTFALEGACKALSKAVGKKFHVLRQGVDVTLIIIVLIITFSTGVVLSIREGIIIGVLICGPLMGVLMKLQKPL